MRLYALALAALTGAAALIFALCPGLDLAVAGFFYGPGGFIGHAPLERFARAVFNVAPFVVLAAFVALYGLRRFGVNAPYAPEGRAAIFLIATMAIGPGLIVNLGMKDHLHRPRPVHVTQFGGSDEFRPWHRFDGACAKNCSFVSGEAAEAFWMVAPASLVPPPWRGPAIGAALAFGVGASVLRMAFGGHFLSDVVFAALLMLLIIEIASALLRPRRLSA
jgi:membrane-associated phospholipid phosphatase